MNLDTNSNHIK